MITGNSGQRPFRVDRNFSEVRLLIASAEGIVSFGDAACAPSDYWVELRELEAGFRFPTSYKWWLSHYGGGEINGEEIFSVYELPLDQVMGGDAVAMSRRSGALDQGRMLLCWPNPSEQYYFRLDDPSQEKRVFWRSEADADEEQYAESFADFLVRRIEFWS